MWTMCQSIFLIPTSLDPPLSSPLDPQHFTIKNVTGGTAQGNKSNFTIFFRCKHHLLSDNKICQPVFWQLGAPRILLYLCVHAYNTNPPSVVTSVHDCNQCTCMPIIVVRIFRNATNIVFPNASVDHWVCWVSQPVPIMVVRILPTLFSQLETENSISFQFILHWIEWTDPKHGVCNSRCTLYLFTDSVT